MDDVTCSVFQKAISHLIFDVTIWSLGRFHYFLLIYKLQILKNESDYNTARPRLVERNQGTLAIAKFIGHNISTQEDCCTDSFENFREYSLWNEENSLKFSKESVQPFSCKKIICPMKFGNS